MSGYPGMSWPNPTPGGQGGNDSRASEGTLRALRDERATLAQGIGEYLYRLVMSGQMRDPAVIAACRPLYEMEQQILRMEAMLGSGAPSSSLPAPIGSPPPQTRTQNEDVTALMAGQRPAWQSGPPIAATPGAASASASHDFHNPAHAHTADRECSHCHMPLKATDRVCPVCGNDTADARPLSSIAVTPAVAAAKSTRCHRCGTDLRPQDRTCPVCGTAAP